MKRIISYKKNKVFHTTLINFIYQFKCTNDEIMPFIMISRLLSKSSKKFYNEALFLKERLNKYIISYNVSSQSVNNVYFLNFSLLIPNDNIIVDSSLKEQILYLLDSIYYHNLNDINIFNIEKELLLESLLNNYKNIEFIAEKNLFDILDNDGIFNKLKYSDIDNIKDLKIQDVINFYDKYIKNTSPRIFVNGNINIEYLDSIIDEYFIPMNLKRTRVIKNYNSFYKNDLVSKYRVDKCNFYQSIVYEVYTVKDYNENDFYVFYLLHLLLNSSSSDLLFNNLRKKSNLVYTCGTSVLIKNGLLFIKALTNKENISLVKIIIKELLNDLKNISKYQDNIDNVINSYEINLEREKDNFLTITTNIINKYFNTDISTQEELKLLKNIDADALINLINRLDLIYEYTLEGEL